MWLRIPAWFRVSANAGLPFFPLGRQLASPLHPNQAPVRLLARGNGSASRVCKPSNPASAVPEDLAVAFDWNRHCQCYRSHDIMLRASTKSLILRILPFERHDRCAIAANCLLLRTAHSIAAQSPDASYAPLRATFHGLAPKQTTHWPTDKPLRVLRHSGTKRPSPPWSGSGDVTVDILPFRQTTSQRQHSHHR